MPSSFIQLVVFFPFSSLSPLDPTEYIVLRAQKLYTKTFVIVILLV